MLFSVLASTPIKFLVGENKKLFTVHAALIAYHSKPLGVLVNGHMLEAKLGCATQEDVDEHTFVRFSQFAYTGEYNTANAVILLGPSTIATTHVAPGGVPEDEEVPDVDDIPAEVDTWSGFMIHKNKKGKGVVVVSKSPSLAPPPQPFKWFPTHEYGNRESCEDHTEVFLYHVRLYVFADKYDIDSLKCLALHKLHRTLVRFTLYNERVDDIVDLIRCSYSNAAGRVGSADSLRALVIHYAACEVETLAKNEGFRSLLEEAGSVAGDLVEQMVKRLD